ncbi:pyrimidine-nucleoside phosphorylase [Merdimmobilis hominis]|jgi:pyrimidine-nucleoside phosphorylase|uniref:Pyrimidine-nucleoside phosphorylase n=1 Tax=uncultured Anaerotruncus sp. TaxID=905011 RepID=A0A6N2QXK9_9FIRM|nr:pyrimidine-nucleoside phosphorylase [Merdimmobilis hominis]MCD4836863.1 pyrimidine-nucleoside phosphorylase [Merdimmobilis hominis]PWL63912.1 MAG: pyrimidine-nucleoside phosphorylase [Oscillospiraceae bacterium]
MRMYDLIQKKRDGGILTETEIRFLVDGVVDGSIPDYQLAAMMMAIYFRGLNPKETAILTDAMAHSGDVVDLSSIQGVKVDKHSTGGVGDKTTLVIAPIVASCGVPVAKMSGRGLGHTGGTVDKMESIPGLRTSMDQGEFTRIVNQVGVCVVGQSGNLAPADKKLYALRDVTATVESKPLIAASIMSKKIAAGADCILLDVKTGSGAFMKTVEDSIDLAKIMVEIGSHVGRTTAALITDMDRPLGHAVGNSLEVVEAIHTLQGMGPADLTQVCTQLAAGLLELAGKGGHEDCVELVKEAVSSGRALEKLREMVQAQGGDPSYIDHPEQFPRAAVEYEVRCTKGGYITHINTQQVGIASVMLGAGREVKDAPIDHSAGILLYKNIGDRVEEGEPLALLLTGDGKKAREAEKTLLAALSVGREKPVVPPLIHAKVDGSGVTRYEE